MNASIYKKSLVITAIAIAVLTPNLGKAYDESSTLPPTQEEAEEVFATEFQDDFIVIVKNEKQNLAQK